MSLLEHHDGREYQRLSNSRVTERSGEIKAWPCLLSASSGCLGALTCSAAIRVEAVKQCWKELGWERASNSHLESEMALYIHVNGMRHTSDLFTEQIQTFICFFGECSLVSAGTESGDSGNKGNTVGAKLEEKAVWLGKIGCWLLRHLVSIPWQISFPQRSLERSKQPQWCVWDLIILPRVPQAGLYHSYSEQVGRKLSLCFVL